MATSNKPSAKLTKIDMFEFDPSNPLDGPEDPDDRSSVGQLGTCIDNCKDVVVDNVNTDAKAFDITNPCLTCEQNGHSFDCCPVLNSIIHLQKHCIKWKIFLVNENRRETELLQQKEINQLEAECTETKQNKDNFTEGTADSLDAATEPISHISDFAPGEPQMPIV